MTGEGGDPGRARGGLLSVTPPTGLVVLLFTDLADSIELREQLGDDAGEELRQTHFSLLRQAAAASGGQEVKNMGDGLLLVVFGNAVSALSCAVSMQRSVAEHNRCRPGGPLLRVRIGVHARESFCEEDDFFDTAVAVAKRLCGQAQGGQILASELVAGLVGSRGKFRFRPAGRLTLKGLGQPVAAVVVESAVAAARAEPAPAARPHRPSIPRGPKLVGRASELEILEAERRRAAAGEFRCVLVVADPGVGKTRLAGELLARHRRGTLGLSARAYPLGATTAFGLWAEALERHLRTLPGGEVAGLCGGFLDDLAGVLRSVAAVRGSAPQREPSRTRLLEGLAVLVGNLADRLPMVVFLDDVHLADASSWESLGYLARDLSDAPLLVVAAARPVELSEHPVAGKVLFGLEQDGLLRRLKLGPLDRAAVGELAGVVLGEVPSPRLTEWLSERSHGNPLFAIGLLQALLDEGADLSAPTLRRIPEGLVDRVKDRLRFLDEPALSVLQVLAVLGRRVELAELVQLSSRPLDRLGVILERLVGAGLIVEEERGRDLSYEMAHPLIQETIYQSIGGARRKALHRLVARTLLSLERLGEAALHFARCAEMGEAEAVEVLADALRQAEYRLAYRESLTILAALVDLLPVGDQRWLGVADALNWQAEWVHDHRAGIHAVLGIKAMRAIDSVLEGSPDAVRRAMVKSRLASFLAWGTGAVAEAERACRESLALFQQAGDHGRAMLAARVELGWIQAMQGNVSGLVSEAAEVVQAAEAAGEGGVALQAIFATGWGSFYLGQFDRAELMVERARAIARQESNPYRVPFLAGVLAVCYAFDGRIKEAFPLLEEGKSGGPGYREGMLLEFEGLVHWLAGDFPASLRCASEVLAWCPEGLGKRRTTLLVFPALAAVEMDGPDQTGQHLLSDIRMEAAHCDWVFLRQLADHLEGLLAWRENRFAEAMTALHRSASQALAMGQRPFAALVLVDLAEMAAERRERDAAQKAAASVEDAAEVLDRDLYRALADIGAAWAHLSSARARQAAERARTAVELLLDRGYRVFLGRAFYALGCSLATTDRDAARDALQRSAAIFEECGASWRRDRALEVLRQLGSAGRRSATAGRGPDALTRRERDVARLAAQGLTARDIAGRLFIGERTVEGYLASVYAKLGVESKLELVRRASDFGL